MITRYHIFFYENFTHWFETGKGELRSRRHEPWKLQVRVLIAPDAPIQSNLEFKKQP
jgi:hypothetical protein